MKTFKELGLDEGVLNVLSRKGFTEPSEIQEKTIPLALSGEDVIGGSATGSGKTLAFSSSIIQNIEPGKKPQALILTPTRELAEQVSSSIKEFSSGRLNVTPVYGGVDMANQIRKVRKTDVIVGTPGRTLDHLKRETLDLSHVKILVLDEVDRMFDMGFREDVEKILKQCPKEKQTMLFSATISQEIDYLAKRYTENPKEVSVKSYVDHSKLKQVYYDTHKSLKFSLLVHLLKQEDSSLVMVFCNTRRNTDFVANNLKKNGIHAQAIHGGLAQNKRLKIMDDFHKKGVSVLVCTDVAARGLDIKGVSHVYNYDSPPSSNDYIHRIGRTARAGNEGIAINLISDRDYDNFRKVNEDKSLKITEEKVPRVERVRVIFDSPKRGSFSGRNPGRNNFNRNFNKRDNRKPHKRR